MTSQPCPVQQASTRAVLNLCRSFEYLEIYSKYTWNPPIVNIENKLLCTWAQDRIAGVGFAIPCVVSKSVWFAIRHFEGFRSRSKSARFAVRHSTIEWLRVKVL